MLYLGDKAVGDMSDLPQLVGAMSASMPQLVGLGATPAELEAALALLGGVAYADIAAAARALDITGDDGVRKAAAFLRSFPGQETVAAEAILDTRPNSSHIVTNALAAVSAEKARIPPGRILLWGLVGIAMVELTFWGFRSLGRRR